MIGYPAILHLLFSILFPSRPSIDSSFLRLFDSPSPPGAQLANETRKLNPPLRFVVVGIRLFSASNRS